MESIKKVGIYLFKRLTFKRFVILLLLVFFLLPMLFSSSTPPGEKAYEYHFAKGDRQSLNKILTVPVQGVILTEEALLPNPLDFLQNAGVTYGYTVKDSLIRAAEDESIKGVLLVREHVYQSFGIIYQVRQNDLRAHGYRRVQLDMTLS